MFTRAGFVPRMRRTGIVACVSHQLYEGRYRAQLVQLQCGDFAWYARRAFMAWPHQVRIVSLVRSDETWREVMTRAESIYRIDGPRVEAVA